MMLALLLIAVAAAAQISLNAASKHLKVGETVALELQVVDGAVAGVPDIPVSGGLSLDYQGQSQSRVVVNFRSTRITSFSYAMTATQEGTWTVGPLRLQSEGEQLTAPAIQVTVSPRSEQDRAERDVSAAVTDDSLWLGQVVVYRFRFRHRGEVLDARWTPPSFDGFVKEPIGMTQQERSSELDGARYTEQLIDVPLVAAGEGERVIGPAMLVAQVPTSGRSRRDDPFASSPFRALRDVTNETLTADAVPVKIRPLPTEGRPADFSGLIGRFNLQVTPQKTTVRQGDSVTLDVVLSGDGSLQGFKLPAPPADAGFRVYDDDPTVEAAIEDGAYTATARFQRSLVPERQGRLEIPGLRIPVFDPASGTYTVVESAPLTLDVSPGEAGAGEVRSFAGQSGDTRQAVGSLGEDILPVPGKADIGDRAASGLGRWLLPPLVPALGLVLLELGRVVRGRRKDPWDAVTAGLERLPADPGARLGALEQLFREAAALRLGRPAAGLDRGQVATLGEEARALYADLEAARYGGQSVSDLEPRVRTFIARRGA